MRYTIVGDPHLTHKSLDRGTQLFALVEEIGLSTIWLGDFLDTKEVIRGKCLNALIAYLSTSKLQHYVLIGNHDWFNLDCQAHALEALKLLPNVIVVDKPVGLGSLVLLPYIHDQTKLQATLLEHGHPDRILFAHLEVAQFDFGNGHVCTNGLPLSKLGEFKRVVSGHFHKYQQSENLTYVGTPFSQSFGESNQTKYIGMYDTETDELKLAETPFPRHITIEHNCDTGEYTPFERHEGDEVNFYRIILTGTQTKIDGFPKHVYEGLNIKWISRPSDDAVNNVTIDETASNEVQFQKWATDIRKMDPETLKLGLEILGACR